MNIHDIKKSLKLLLAYNIGFVIDLLLEASSGNNEDIDELILHLSRYNDIYRDAQYNRENNDSIRSNMNLLRASIMKYINQAKPNNINFTFVQEQLSQGEKYKSILDHQLKKVDFRGMFEQNVITIESFNFKWEDYFVGSSSQPILNQEALLVALELIHDHFKVEFNFKNVDLDLKSFLIDSLQSMRTLPTLEQHNWAWEIAPASTPKHMEWPNLLAAIHETIEALVDRI